MIKFLNDIRTPILNESKHKQIRNTVIVLILGLSLGLISKFLDCTPSNELPYLFEMMDLRNFFGRLGIWLLLSVVISVYSNTPIRAGINVFIFFTGMLVSYYTYTHFIAGFFPKNYIMIWSVLTMISPFFAAICWYAKGNGEIALFLSSAIVGVLFTQAFSFGTFYFYAAHQGLEILVWLVVIALFYKNPKQLAKTIGISLIVAIIWNAIFPFHF